MKLIHLVLIAISLIANCCSYTADTNDTDINNTGNFLLGYISLKSNKLGLASAYFNKIIEAQEANDDIVEYSYIAILLDKGIDAADHFSSQYPDILTKNNSAHNMITSLKYMKLGFNDMAQAILSNPAMFNEIDNIIRPIIMSWNTALRGKAPEALKILDEYYKKFHDPFIILQQAMIADHCNLKEQANIYYDKILVEYNFSEAVIPLVANFYLRQGNYDIALDIYKIYTKLYPYQIDFSHHMSEIENHTVEIKILSDPFYALANVFNDVASSFIANDMYLTARLYTIFAYYLDQNNQHTHFINAALNYYSSDLDEAIAMFQKITPTSIDYIEAQTNIAKIYFKQDKINITTNVFDRLLTLYPHNLQIYVDYADLYENIGDYKYAISIYDRLLSSLPTGEPLQWFAYYMRGMAYSALGNKKQAQIDMQIASELKNNSNIEIVDEDYQPLSSL